MNASKTRKRFREEIKGTAKEMIARVKQIVKEGNVRRIMIQNKEGKILFQSQLTAGIAGSVMLTVVAPLLSAIGVFVLLMRDIKIVVEKYPDTDMAGKTDEEVEAEFIEINDEK